MSNIDNSFDIELASLLMNERAMNDDGLTFRFRVRSDGIYEFECDEYPDYSRWVDFGIY